MHRTQKFFFSLFFFLHFCGISQSIDDLQKTLLTQKNDSNKVNTLNDLAWEYLNLDLNRADSLSNEAVRLSEKLNYIKGRSSAYNTLGLAAIDKNETEKAVMCFKKSIADKEKLGQTKGKATVLCNLGTAYRAQSKFNEALEVYMASLRLRQSLKDVKGVGDCYNNLGNVYADMGNVSEALATFEEAVKIRRSIGDFAGLALTYNNLSGIYDNRGDYSKQLGYLFLSAHLLDSLKNYNQLAVVYANIGRSNKTLGNYDDALKYANKSEKLSKQVNAEGNLIGVYILRGQIDFIRKNYASACNNYSLAVALIEKGNNTFYHTFCYSGIAMCKEYLGQTKEAAAFYETALKLARKYDNKRELLSTLCDVARFRIIYEKDKDIVGLLNEAEAIAHKEGYGELLQKTFKQFGYYYYDVRKKPDSAAIYFSKCVEINDSIFSEDVKSSFAQMQTKFETRQKDAEINLLKQADTIKSLQLQEDTLKVQKRNYALASLALVILLMGLLGYLYFQQQKRRSATLKEQAVKEAEEQERLRLAKDIHDDFGSGLSKIRFLGELMDKQSKNNPEIQSGLRSISEISSSLVENMRDLVWALDPENASIDSLVARIREYCSDYFEDLNIPLQITVDEKIPESRITKETNRHIFFIVKEAFQNIVKHAACSKAELEIHFRENQMLLKIKDNGKGFNPKEKGNGLRNMKQRAERIGAALDIGAGTNGGTELKLSVDLEKLIRN